LSLSQDRDNPPQVSADGSPNQAGRWLTHVVLACVVGIAVAGMALGFYGSVDPNFQTDSTQDIPASKPGDTSVPRAITYSQMKGAPMGPNAGWTTAWPNEQDDPTRLYGSDPASEQDRAADTARRAQRRAFDGAPPVVPHAIDQQNASSCLVCHEKGMRVGTVVAPRMSHETYANCTQCHVESVNRALPPTAVSDAPTNGFTGLIAPGPGERAWPGAPPVVPHTTWMRESCTSCHGSQASKGLRTSHPWRGNCLQCHALSAQLDQWRQVGGEQPPQAGLEESSP
jgi:nitrate reductase (cytochrome), electron transfer subunit